MSGIDGLCSHADGPLAVSNILRWAGFHEARTIFWKKQLDVTAQLSVASCLTRRRSSTPRAAAAA